MPPLSDAFEFSRRVRCVSALALVVLASLLSFGQATETLPLYEAMREGKVVADFTATGASSGDSIEMTVRGPAVGNRPLRLSVPPGLFLRNGSGSWQSMVVSGVRGRSMGGGRYVPTSTITLTNAVPSATYVLSAYCAEFQKDNPSPNSRFTVEPPEETLACILSNAEKQGLSVQATQAAVWIYTDHVDYGTMSHKFSISESDWTAASAVANACRFARAPSQPAAEARSPSGTNQPEIPPLAQKTMSSQDRQWALSHSTNPHALVGAVNARDQELVQELLNKGANVNAAACNPAGGCTTPLTSAIFSGDAGIVRTLLMAHADVDTRADRQHASRTVLCDAAAVGNANIVRILIANGATVNAPDANGTTPLMWAAMQGHIEVIRVLLASGADPTATDSHGRTAAMIAILTKHDAVGALLAAPTILPSSQPVAGPIFPQLSSGQASRESPNPSSLLAAVSSRDATQVRKLLDQGANVNSEDCHAAQCYTPLYVAAGLNGDPVITQMLIAAGANLEARDATRGATVLITASLQGYTDVVRVLLDRGADINARAEKNNGDTALMVSSSKGHVDVVRLLIAHHAEVNAKNEKGHTALWFADVFKQNEVIPLLKSAGARK